MRTTRTTLFAGTFALALLLLPWSGAAAQGDPMADHPIVGASLVDAKPSEPGVNLHTSIFNADGTTTDSSPGSSGKGVWRPTGESTADVTFMEVVRTDDGREATLTVNTSLEVSEDHATWVGTHSVRFSPEMAEILGTADRESGPLAVTARRIVLEPMVDARTPRSAAPAPPSRATRATLEPDERRHPRTPRLR